MNSVAGRGETAGQGRQESGENSNVGVVTEKPPRVRAVDTRVFLLLKMRNLLLIIALPWR